MARFYALPTPHAASDVSISAADYLAGLPFRSASFDLIYSQAALCKIEAAVPLLPGVLDEALRTLRVGGSALLEVGTAGECSAPGCRSWHSSSLPGQKLARLWWEWRGGGGGAGSGEGGGTEGVLGGRGIPLSVELSSEQHSAWASALSNASRNTPLEVVIGRVPHVESNPPSCEGVSGRSTEGAAGGGGGGAGAKGREGGMEGGGACALAALFGSPFGMLMAYVTKISLAPMGGSDDSACAAEAERLGWLARLSRHGDFVKESVEQARQVTRTLRSRSGGVRHAKNQDAKVQNEAVISAVRIWFRTSTWAGLRVFERRDVDSDPQLEW